MIAGVIVALTVYIFHGGKPLLELMSGKVGINIIEAKT